MADVTNKMGQTDTQLDYTNAEWLEDFAFLKSLCGAGKSSGAVTMEAGDYFQSKYHGEHSPRLACFLAAMRYLDENVETLSSATRASGGEQVLVSDEILLALRDYFCCWHMDAVQGKPDHARITRLVISRLRAG